MGLEEALRSVREIELVGIAELYEESFCVFEYRLRGTLGKGCTCEEPLPLSEHTDHGVPPHDINDVTRNKLEPEGSLTDVVREFPVSADKSDMLLKRLKQST